jgi:hypothetical protein
MPDDKKQSATASSEGSHRLLSQPRHPFACDITDDGTCYEAFDFRGACRYSHSDRRTAELPRWLHRYNWHRPHGGSVTQAPISPLGLSEHNLWSATSAVRAIARIAGFVRRKRGFRETPELTPWNAQRDIIPECRLRGSSGNASAPGRTASARNATYRSPPRLGKVLVAKVGRRIEF